MPPARKATAPAYPSTSTSSTVRRLPGDASADSRRAPLKKTPQNSAAMARMATISSHMATPLFALGSWTAPRPTIWSPPAGSRLARAKGHIPGPARRLRDSGCPAARHAGTFGPGICAQRP